MEAGSFLDDLAYIALSHPFNLEYFLSLQLDVSVFQPFRIILPNLDLTLYIGNLCFKIYLFFLDIYKFLSLWVCSDIFPSQVLYIVQGHQYEMIIKRWRHNIPQIETEKDIADFGWSENKTIVNWNILNIVSNLDDSVFFNDLILIWWFLFIFDCPPPSLYLIYSLCPCLCYLLFYLIVALAFTYILIDVWNISYSDLM